MPKLKEMFEKFAEIPAALQPFYEEQEDGSGIFSGLDGATKDKLKEFRENNIGLRKKVEDFETALKEFDGVDAKEFERLKQLKAQIEKSEDAKLISEGKLDEVMSKRTAAMRSENEKLLNTKNTRIKELEDQNRQLLSTVGKFTIKDGITAALEEKKVKVRPGAFDDVVARAHNIFEVDENGVPRPFEVKDGKKTTKYGPDTEPYNFNNFITDLTEAGSHLLEPGVGGGGGGGGKPPVGTGGKPTILRSDKEAFAKNIEKIAKGEVIVVNG